MHLGHSGDGISKMEDGILSVLGALARQLSQVGTPHFTQQPFLYLIGKNAIPQVEQMPVSPPERGLDKSTASDVTDGSGMALLS